MNNRQIIFTSYWVSNCATFSDRIEHVYIANKPII